jgi:hypothetical protein
MCQAVNNICGYTYIPYVEFPWALFVLELCLYFDLDYKRFALHNPCVTSDVTMQNEDGIK